jgi:hypothetical protein
VTKPFITEADFKRELAEFLQSGPPPEIGEEVERLQMLLATPGDWAAAEHQAPDYTESPDPQVE